MPMRPVTAPPRLPEPDADARAHSARVAAHIADEIAAAGGWISFARYMELALYAPGLGYYTGGAAKFGAAGDFVTAPEITPLFGATLAAFVQAVRSRVGGDVLELGAGSGRLALDLLMALAGSDGPPAHYFILEPSPDLRARQQALFATQAPELLARVRWLDALPDDFVGVVLANEVLDALPAHVLVWRDGQPLERGVACLDGVFVWRERPLEAGELVRAARAIAPAGVGYVSEISLAAPALVATLGERLASGVLLLLDYGFPRAEYYHPQRAMGTLRAHYRHHALDDPFFLPGLADLTTHVDFSAVALAGEAAGLELLGYTSQGQFLLDAGLLQVLAGLTPGSLDYLRAAAAVQKLVQPHEMGELFKAIAFGRGWHGELPGFRRGDRRGALQP